MRGLLKTPAIKPPLPIVRSVLPPDMDQLTSYGAECMSLESIVILTRKFINCLMHDGKKSTAQRVLMDTFDLIKTNGLAKYDV